MLADWIKQCEGYSAKPYTDTHGKLTIGWGRNLSANGISESEAEMLLDNDIKAAVAELAKFDWYIKQPVGVQNALVNMCFNLGITKLLLFKGMISALEDKDYEAAATECLHSNWARQVGDRAIEVANMIKQGYENKS